MWLWWCLVVVLNWFHKFVAGFNEKQKPIVATMLLLFCVLFANYLMLLLWVLNLFRIVCWCLLVNNFHLPLIVVCFFFLFLIIHFLLVFYFVCLTPEVVSFSGFDVVVVVVLYRLLYSVLDFPRVSLPTSTWWLILLDFCKWKKKKQKWS